MARVQPEVRVPAPPTWLSISHVPDRSAKGAVEWYKQIGVDVTERWLKSVTDRRELVCRIIAGRRYYSPEELWRFIVTRPTRTVGAARYASAKYQQRGNKTA